MDQNLLKMLKDLTDAPGAPGNEGQVKKVMEHYIAPYSDEVTGDRLGSLIARKAGDSPGPKIAVAGHLDEIGFMITKILDNGYLQIQPLGFWWTHNMMAQRVDIITRKKTVPGVIGFKFPDGEDLKKVVDMKKMFIDVGAASKEEAESFGIRPGDTAVPAASFTVMENEKLLMAKAWDNRIGCAIAIEVLKQLKEESHPNTVYGVGNVQEEVGLRGARTTTHQINPDLVFAVDVTIANDVPGVSDSVKMGKGPVLFMKDVSMIAHQPLLNYVRDTAEELDIPYQLDALLNGGTDAGSTHLSRNGVPSLAITIPTRYIHSHASMLHTDDFENAVRLIVALIKKLDQSAFNNLIRS